MLDVAIVGEGFFQIKDASGAIYYCRAGRFCLNANGQIVLEAADSCRLLEPAITVPSDATRVAISADGTIAWRTPGSNSLQQGGTIQLAKFINPQGLRRIGDNLYAESDGSGTAQTGDAGENGFGKLRQGWIEQSNVDLEDEIAEWKRVRKTCRSIRKLLNEKE
jgi:flagellar basal-body rod protein FlgG